MRKKGTLITMRSCQWKHMLGNLQAGIKTQMGDILCKSNEKSLLKSIQNDSVYGFVVCDVKTPDELVKSYGDFLFPWVIKRHTVTRDLMSPLTLSQCDSEYETVIQCFNGEQLLIVSTMVKFYISIGLEISNVTKFIQFVPNRALQPFVKKVIQLRTEAKKEGDAAKSLTAKLVGNSGYGKTSENVSRHKQTRIYTDDKKLTRNIRSRFCCNNTDLFTELEVETLAECTNQKKRVKDSKPIHMGVAILQEAKLLFMEFMFFMFTHLQPGSFKNLYCDTDSIAIGKVDFFSVYSL